MEVRTDVLRTFRGGDENVRFYDPHKRADFLDGVLRTSDNAMREGAARKGMKKVEFED